MKKKLISTITGGLIAFIFALIPFISVSAWGPERTTYTVETPAPYATFNSITDNTAVGDERNFVRIKEVGTSDAYRDEIEITPGKEYEVYIYYHNDAASNTNSAGYGMATNTRLSSAYPTIVNTGERGMISGIISWSYVTPTNDQPTTGKVWDEAYVTSSVDGVVLRYKPGTAIIHNSGSANGSVLPEALFTEDGTPIGFNKLAGTIPGCAEYSGHITYTLVAENTDISLSKQVSTDGANWQENVAVKPGEYVTYRVVFNNTGNTPLTNVIFKDSHDDGLKIRIGSVKIFDVNNVEGKVIDDILDISGYNVGDVAAGALVQVIYQAQVSEDESYCGKTLKNTISAKYNSTEEKTDDSIVTVYCEGTPPELPHTGPLEIVMAAVVIAGLGGGGYYLYKTRKALTKAESAAKGAGNQASDSATPEASVTSQQTPESQDTTKTHDK